MEIPSMYQCGPWEKKNTSNYFQISRRDVDSPLKPTGEILSILIISKWKVNDKEVSVHPSWNGFGFPRTETEAPNSTKDRNPALQTELPEATISTELSGSKGSHFVGCLDPYRSDVQTFRKIPQAHTSNRNPEQGCEPFFSLPRLFFFADDSPKENSPLVGTAAKTWTRPWTP